MAYCRTTRLSHRALACWAATNARGSSWTWPTCAAALNLSSHPLRPLPPWLRQNMPVLAPGARLALPAVPPLLLTLSFLASRPLMWTPHVCSCVTCSTTSSASASSRRRRRAGASRPRVTIPALPKSSSQPDPQSYPGALAPSVISLTLTLAGPDLNPGPRPNPNIYVGAPRPRATPSTAATAKHSRRWTAAGRSCRTITCCRSTPTCPSSAGRQGEGLAPYSTAVEAAAGLRTLRAPAGDRAYLGGRGRRGVPECRSVAHAVCHI